MHWNLMNEYEFGCMKLVKLKYRRGNQIIRTFCKIGSPQKLGPPSLICRNFNTQRKVLLNHAETFKNDIQNGVPNNSDFLNSESCRKHWNLANDYEFGSIKLLKLKYRRGEKNNSDLLQKWFPPEIRSPLFNLETFEHSEKTTPESCRMHWNLMSDEEIASKKLLKLKSRKGDKIIQTFCKIGSTKKLGPPSLIWRNFKTVRRVPLNHVECIEI